MEMVLRDEVDLGHGRTLVVRDLTPADCPVLGAFFRDLPELDRRYRFFSASVPSPKALQRWFGDGCHHLGAFVRTAEGERIVGHAMLCPMQPDAPPGGSAELGICVAPDWRGWLGPYLLDALLRVAAEDGFSELEAEIRLDNQEMLALVTHHGMVVEGPHDPQTTRVHLRCEPTAVTSRPPVRS